MKQNLDTILDICIDRIINGRETVEACLADYPAYARELRPLLLTAMATRSTLELSADPARKRAHRQRLFHALDAYQGTAQTAPMTVVHRLLAWPRRWALVTAAVVILLSAAGASTVAASSGSTPSQLLYPVKRATENVQLTLTFNKGSKAALHAKLADRRADEMAAVAQRGEQEGIDDLEAALRYNLDQVHQLSSGPALQPPLATPPPGVTPGPRPRPSNLPPGLQRKLRERLQQNLNHQEAAFRELIEKGNPNVKGPLSRAMESSRLQYKTLLESLEEPQ